MNNTLILYKENKSNLEPYSTNNTLNKSKHITYNPESNYRCNSEYRHKFLFDSVVSEQDFRFAIDSNLEAENYADLYIYELEVNGFTIDEQIEALDDLDRSIQDLVDSLLELSKDSPKACKDRTVIENTVRYAANIIYINQLKVIIADEIICQINTINPAVEVSRKALIMFLEYLGYETVQKKIDGKRRRIFRLKFEKENYQ